MTAVGTVYGNSSASVAQSHPASTGPKLDHALHALSANGAVKRLMVFDTTIDPACLVDAAGATVQITGCVGANLGDFVLPSFSLDLQDITVTAYVQAAGVIEFRIQNEGGADINLASGTLSALVFCRT